MKKLIGYRGWSQEKPPRRLKLGRGPVIWLVAFFGTIFVLATGLIKLPGDLIFGLVVLFIFSAFVLADR